MEILIWLEQSGLGVWVRESPSIFAFPGILVFHTIGMAFLMGSSVAIDLRLLGLSPSLPLPAMEKFFPVMWCGFWINAVSGVGLLIAYPVKAFTNPVFYLKLTLVLLAVVIIRLIQSQVLRNPSLGAHPAPMQVKLMAITSLAIWIGVTTSGRLLAYTYVRLMSTDF